MWFPFEIHKAPGVPLLRKADLHDLPITGEKTMLVSLGDVRAMNLSTKWLQFLLE